jgi:hypothetical protein
MFFSDWVRTPEGFMSANKKHNQYFYLLFILNANDKSTKISYY